MGILLAASEWVEARDSIQNPAMTRIAPHNKNYPSPISRTLRLRKLPVDNGEMLEVSKQGSDKIMSALILSQT